MVHHQVHVVKFREAAGSFVTNVGYSLLCFGNITNNELHQLFSYQRAGYTYAPFDNANKRYEIAGYTL